jgi:hypothetical protein
MTSPSETAMKQMAAEDETACLSAFRFRPSPSRRNS